MNNTSHKKFYLSLLHSIMSSLFYIFVLVSSFWLCLALWIHQPFGRMFTYIAITVWVCLSLSITGIYIAQAIFKRSTDVMIYIICFSLGLAWFFGMQPRNDRQWNPEVERILDYQKDGSIITIENVRNFTWRSSNDYDIHWETRQYNLDQLESMDLVLSYWAGNQIAHTLVSFGFVDGTKLSFSIEIRKEIHEEFSAIGGFFRQYELALVPADEKDIIYTRSNIRNERVYIYPVKMSKPLLQELFLSYLDKGKAMRTDPRWYNTLFSNCTTLIFDMVNNIEPVPVDYRVILSGLLPAYLYDEEVLNHEYTLNQWKQMAHINPKVINFDKGLDQTSQHYSQLIRSGFPKNQ